MRTAMTEEAVAKFWSKTASASTGCFVWTGAKNAGGYGIVPVARRSRLAHRVAYELAIGPIPEGLQLDHLCRVRHCVNPAHLEPVTGAENTRRGLASKINAERERSKTRCPAGHRFDTDNTYPDARGWRGCRECRNEASRRYRARKAAELVQQKCDER
jgi:hypothetical protein